MGGSWSAAASAIASPAGAALASSTGSDSGAAAALLSITVTSALTGEPISKVTKQACDTVASVLRALEAAADDCRTGHLILGHKVLPVGDTLGAVGVRDGSTVAFVLARPPALVTASGREAEVWDPAAGQPLRALRGHRRRLVAAAFGGHGRLLVTASTDGTAKLWDFGVGVCLQSLETELERLTSAALSEDGSLLAVASAAGLAQVWGLRGGHGGGPPAAGQPAGRLQARRWHAWRREGASSVAFSPDGHSVAMNGSDGVASTWEASSGRLFCDLVGHAGPVNSAAYSPDGGTVITASSDRSVMLWAAATGERLQVLQGGCRGSGMLRSACLSPDLSSVLVCWGATAQIWSRASGECLQVMAHQGALTSAAFSRDGAFVATGAADGAAKVWSSASCRCAYTIDGHGDVVACAAFASQ